MNTKRTWSIVAMAGALVLAAACDQSDVVAPDGATITLAATPATILLSDGRQAGEVTILATVRDGIGVPLPGQDVRFTNTSGDLTPQAGTPVETDDLGNAVTFLNNATAQTTITAQSGKATHDISLQTTTCNISSLALDQTALNFTSCVVTDTGGFFNLLATVTDTSGKACVGVQVSFTVTGTAAQNDVTINVVVVGSATSNASGQVTAKVTLGSDCETKCHNQDCNTGGRQIVASGGGITSDAVDINTNIP